MCPAAECMVEPRSCSASWLVVVASSPLCKVVTPQCPILQHPHPTNGMSLPKAQGCLPMPSLSIAFISDAAANIGYIFISPHHLPHATSTLAWFIHHSFSVYLEYFHGNGDATAKYPGLSTDIAMSILEEGAAVLAVHPPSQGLQGPPPHPSWFHWLFQRG